jgi:hypothetical protein
MALPTATKVLLLCASLFALAGICIGCVFMRTSQPKTAFGIIRNKIGYGGGTYQQQQVGIDRGFRTPNQIAIAASYTFEVEVEGLTEKARCSLNTIAAEKFEVGQKVRVQYIHKGMKPIWSRVYVTSMEAAQ